MSVDVAETVTRRKTHTTTAAVTVSYATFEVLAANLTDTITLDQFTTLSNAKLFKWDGTAVNCTISGNIITITGALTATDLVGFAMGV